MYDYVSRLKIISAFKLQNWIYINLHQNIIKIKFLKFLSLVFIVRSFQDCFKYSLKKGINQRAVLAT